MHYLKPSLFILLILQGLNFHTDKPKFTKWVTTEECFLKVNGSTNINKFTCTIPKYYRQDTLMVYNNNSANPIKITGRLELDEQSFDCHNSVMTKDLRKTLKVKDFPKLIIRFISLSSYPDFAAKDGILTGVVAIELAGVSKQFDIDYKYVSEDKHTLTLVGTRLVNFTDFNLVPPRKLGGLIKTNNELNVEFDIKVRIIE